MATEKPLAGCILSFTAVPQTERAALTNMALELGAICRADLTIDVTHLVAADIQTEKYRYAARHRPDIILMQTSWLPKDAMACCFPLWRISMQQDT